ncbi:Hydroxylamine reductase [Alkalidesulfovibrio alkalitolerans DSM 16529]|uniref:Hydroxylamine reductase n=1 Tax=Alkalidesulfovibrio alkalitolerans DSM 16529 TaxID=1121439 RepID=S7T1R2_9BACT|nr:hydroxylamine reductase [Alkalidesulfovibrio alkalitolerans]EPR30501.1 Hydroxylamine reductase [Alkalidesulfovibrio alkalitolerans DSM 16529]
MFCYQCEQTAAGTGCTKVGVCGKQPDVAALQDLLVYFQKGLAQVALAAREKGVYDASLGHFMARAIFSTLTNVDFDGARLIELIRETVSRRDALAAKVKAAGGSVPRGPATLAPAADQAGMIAQGEEHGIEKDPELNADIKSLKQTLIYGLKGVSAYADHAAILGQEDDEVYKFLQEALAATERLDLPLDKWVGMVLECGRINLRAMELLDAGNTGTYGHPVPTSVPLGAKAGKAIVISGHDLKDLQMLLEQTVGKGINIYTHGEMIPTHGYPELKKHPHFFGHFGTAWQNQQKEFGEFPGAILMTTNCLQRPRNEYMDNIFTTGLVAWPGAQHIAEKADGSKDFSPVIEKALAMPGYPADTDKGSVLVGFGRNTVMSVADKVIEAVKGGAIKHFFLVGGCDGAKPGRNYYTEFVEKAPKDTVILTLACGKFRFFDKQLGDIGGIPRLLDVGQCNDAYSAIQIAVALSKAFDCGVNDLPLSLILSWYEQKAVAILLTLLYLGIKNIRIGPSLPAFLTPNVLNVLVQNYNIMPITTPDQDLKAILG